MVALVVEKITYRMCRQTRYGSNRRKESDSLNGWGMLISYYEEHCKGLKESVLVMLNMRCLLTLQGDRKISS